MSIFHGDSYTRFYRIWNGMRYRGTKTSLQKSKKCYINVTMCKRWMKYTNFKADMFDAYQLSVRKHGEADTTLDRINSSKGYSKVNCRWATRKEQLANSRHVRLISYRGRVKNLSEWASLLDVDPKNLSYRLDKLKMTVEEAFKKPFAIHRDRKRLR